MNSKNDNLSKILSKYNIEKYQNKKIKNTFRIFNLVLIFDILVIAVSIGVIIGHFVL